MTYGCEVLSRIVSYLQIIVSYRSLDVTHCLLSNSLATIVLAILIPCCPSPLLSTPRAVHIPCCPIPMHSKNKLTPMNDESLRMMLLTMMITMVQMLAAPRVITIIPQLLGAFGDDDDDDRTTLFPFHHVRKQVARL